MKNSITKRLFISIILIVVGFTLLILLSNTLLLRPFYYRSLKSTMISAMSDLSAIDYTQETDDWIDDLAVHMKGNAYDIVIQSDEVILFSSSSEVGLMPRPGMMQGILKPRQSDQPHYLKKVHNWETAGENIYVGTTKLNNNNIEMMVCLKELDGIEIFLTQPIEPVNDSIMQANTLLIACAVIALGVAVIFVFNISKRFTKPIKQIQSTVSDIAALNFAHRCNVRTGDELESLGTDVNALSDKLRDALEALKKQNAQLEKDVLAQKQFISNASHELRTPLSLIKGYADEMNIGNVKDDAQREAYVNIIAEESTKMNRLLSEMLELSRMESGRIAMQNETRLIREQIESFFEKYDGFIAEKDLKISLQLDENAVGEFDPMRFEQVLANYISNAAKYGDDEKRIEISTKMEADTIRISVFNTGKHIPESKMETLWDGFYKTDEARTRTDDSYGLGLSVVKAIQNVAGQEYGVENTYGGVVFWFDVKRH